MATIPYRKLYIDAGAWIAMVNKKDKHHLVAIEFYVNIPQSVELYTSCLVISESFTWLRYHLGGHIALKFISALEKASTLQSLNIIYPDAIIDIKTRQYLNRFNDQTLSYSDAASFVICDQLKINNVFGFDNDFYIVKKSLWPVGSK